MSHAIDRTREPEPTPEPELNDRQRDFLKHVAGGMPAQQAAKAAGYAPGYARKASRLLKLPAVATALEAVRSEARREVVYTLLEAVDEIDKAVLFAYDQKNSMAIAKLLEAKGRLFGLYVDRTEIVSVDLTGALARAEARVLNAADTPSVASTRKPIDWRPRIPGSRIADREAGPADDESEAEVESARRIGK